MHKEIALTPEGQVKLEEELRHLETVRRREVGERIKEAKEFGDISENSEYDDAKNEQAWVESRIAEVSLILAHATIIDRPKNSGKVSLGSKIQLRDVDSGKVFTYRIVGSAEADPSNDRISNESPVGQAVVGKKKGETAVVRTPTGREITFEVVAITR
jgi:transcription elongation factor GreA